MNLNAVAANIHEYDPDNNKFKLVGTSRTVLTSREGAGKVNKIDFIYFDSTYTFLNLIKDTASAFKLRIY